MSPFHPVPDIRHQNVSNGRSRPIADLHQIGQPSPMVTTAILMLASSVTAEPCDLAAIKTARASYEALSRRAVQVIALAVPKSSRSEARLKTLVDPSASFALGAGDVGRPLGSGIAGVSALARTMNADRFQYQGWDYMDRPADA